MIAQASDDSVSVVLKLNCFMSLFPEVARDNSCIVCPQIHFIPIRLGVGQGTVSTL